MLRKLDQECDKWGLTSNTDKLEYILVDGDCCNLNISKRVVQAIKWCKHLDVKMINNGSREAEIRYRIKQEKLVSRQLN